MTKELLKMCQNKGKKVAQRLHDERKKETQILEDMDREIYEIMRKEPPRPIENSALYKAFSGRCAKCGGHCNILDGHCSQCGAYVYRARGVAVGTPEYERGQ